MTEKQKGVTAPETQHKSNSISLKMQVLSILRLEKITAKALNDRLHFNDARKAISVLRQEHHTIRDYRLANGCKIYYLAHSNQLTLF